MNRYSENKKSWGKHPNQFVRPRAEHLWGGSSLVSRNRCQLTAKCTQEMRVPTNASGRTVWGDSKFNFGRRISLHTPSPVVTLEYRCSKDRCTVLLGPVVLEHNAPTDTRVDLPALSATVARVGGSVGRWVGGPVHAFGAGTYPITPGAFFTLTPSRPNLEQRIRTGKDSRKAGGFDVKRL